MRARRSDFVMMETDVQRHITNVPSVRQLRSRIKIRFYFFLCAVCAWKLFYGIYEKKLFLMRVNNVHVEENENIE